MDTVSATVLSGVLVLVIGQAIQRSVLEPLEEFRVLRGEIAHALLYYANVSGGVMNDASVHEARDTLRDYAARLWQRAFAIPRQVFWCLALICIVPSWTGIEEASRNLIGWSNSLGQAGGPERESRRTAIRTALRLRPGP